MPRKTPSGLTLLVSIDPDSPEPLYRQVYQEIREAILRGRVAPGTRLPSTRTLAAELNVSRNTILTAFEHLWAEGYLEGKVGSGTRVSRELPDELLQVGAQATPVRPLLSRTPSISRRALVVAEAPFHLSSVSGPPRPFQVGLPAVREFPLDLWRRLAARRWRRSASELLNYGVSAGYRPLREVIASYLGSSRGVKCTADQVLIVAGSQHALDLAARVLLNPGDAVWMEDPGYHAARGAFIAAEAQIHPVPLDREGFDLTMALERAPEARLAYVTPSHQFPVGVTMSLRRRLELLQWASRSSGWILEDDYDSEFRYVSRPISALQGLDEDGRVIYTGTFSKVLFPSLRLGYLVVPDEVVDAFTAMLVFASTQAPTIEQAILTDFIAEGHFERHIRRMRSLYHERQEALIATVNQEVKGLLEVRAAEAGMHLTAWLPPGIDDTAASEWVAEAGVSAMPLSAFAVEPPERGGLVLGYAGFTAYEVRTAGRRLGSALRSALAGGGVRGGHVCSQSAG
ncbi:MAG TPA: PLP-dependent aminotransferase family protein [Longimicrobiaceae bacterium]|nr:PLP-dependent aminotransferase family protein [Longimicrobiaceae bacterium]